MRTLQIPPWSDRTARYGARGESLEQALERVPQAMQ